MEVPYDQSQVRAVKMGKRKDCRARQCAGCMMNDISEIELSLTS